MILLIALGPYVLVWSIIVALSLVFIKRALYKAVVIVVFSVGIWLFLFWDTIPARMEFNKLCEKDAGIHIYKTIEIGSGYFDNGVLDYDRLKEENMYAYESRRTSINTKYNISKLHNSLLIDGEVYLEIFVYSYKGGWFFNRFIPKGEDCPNDWARKNYLTMIFKEKNND
tara:strand:- start:9806 stop:10315 length:510 start_codon:yes stop_codon:yes gene_type:complete